MTFIGVISDNKSFEVIKEKFKIQGMELIHINNRSINNIKNITFDMIIINKELKGFKEKKNVIERICLKSKYLIINTDIKIELNLEESKVNIITFRIKS